MEISVEETETRDGLKVSIGSAVLARYTAPDAALTA